MSQKVYTQLQDEHGRELWTTAQFAEHCGVSPQVARSYVSRNHPGTPRPVGYYEDTTKAGPPTRVFLASDVIEYQKTRLGKGKYPRN